MKKSLIFLLIISLFSASVTSAQELEKMNKSELREQVVNLIAKIDSLKTENKKYENLFIKLTENLSQLEQRSSQLENKFKSNELEIVKLNKIIADSEVEKKRIISSNQIEISKLNKKLLVLQDSIQGIQSVVSYDTSVSLNTNDFLNQYYFNQIPLPNNSFSLILSKLVYGSELSNERYSYNDDENKGAVIRIPEILDANSFTYWSVKPNIPISPWDFNKFLLPKNSDYFNTRLPKIEILKNKLFTLKYIDGKEESFLFNVKKFVSKLGDNQRKVLQIELANEQVKDDGSNDTSRDIVWRFFAIENECYLALTAEQLNRLDLKLTPVNNGIEIFDENSKTRFVNQGYYSNDNWKTTGQGIYLSRNKDIFMSESRYVDPDEVIYLFKLK
jgi:hypothetical protein